MFTTGNQSIVRSTRSIALAAVLAAGLLAGCTGGSASTTTQHASSGAGGALSQQHRSSGSGGALSQQHVSEGSGGALAGSQGIGTGSGGTKAGPGSVDLGQVHSGSASGHLPVPDAPDGVRGFGGVVGSPGLPAPSDPPPAWVPA